MGAIESEAGSVSLAPLPGLGAEEDEAPAGAVEPEGSVEGGLVSPMARMPVPLLPDGTFDIGDDELGLDEVVVDDVSEEPSPGLAAVDVDEVLAGLALDAELDEAGDEDESEDPDVGVDPCELGVVVVELEASVELAAPDLEPAVALALALARDDALA